jgi:RNA polymerase sigma-70 factor (ECF subfamily)
MSTAPRLKVAITNGGRHEPAGAPPPRIKAVTDPVGPALAEFEHMYRNNVDSVMSYFARRCAEPQTVADLTSETFVRAAGGFASFDPGRGSARGWIFGIAGHVFASHCEQTASGRDAVARLAGHRTLDIDEIEELTARIDAERYGRALLERCSRLPDVERSALELVDLTGLTPKEAARALGVSRVALRKRLSRARARLRKDHRGHE